MRSSRMDSRENSPPVSRPRVRRRRRSRSRSRDDAKSNGGERNQKSRSSRRRDRYDDDDDDYDEDDDDDERRRRRRRRDEEEDEEEDEEGGGQRRGGGRERKQQQPPEKRRKRRTFSSKSPTREEKKNVVAEDLPKYGYQPRAPNPNGKQSVPKHPQSMVAAKHVSINDVPTTTATTTTTKTTTIINATGINNGDATGRPLKGTTHEEIAAYQKKKQRDARRWLLSQQISAYENLSVPNSDSERKQRQVYVGNIPPEVDAETLNVFLSSTLSAAYPEALASGKYPNDSLIEEIRMSADRKYCFATVVDPDMATALFAINGVDLCGYTLMIARPSGWVDPQTMKEKADIAYEQMKIIQAEERAELGENLPAHLAAAQNVAAASAKKIEGETIALAGKGDVENPSSSTATVYVRLKHIATEEDVNDDEEYEDLKLDVAAECEKFCSHSSSGGSSGSTLALPRRGPFLGSAFAKFRDQESALKAKEGMHGRAFDGRIIEGSFASESEYEQAVKDQ
jgi:hypothetical protein